LEDVAFRLARHAAQVLGLELASEPAPAIPCSSMSEVDPC
jgi:hypothetical protein